MADRGRGPTLTRRSRWRSSFGWTALLRSGRRRVSQIWMLTNGAAFVDSDFFAADVVPCGRETCGFSAEGSELGTAEPFGSGAWNSGKPRSKWLRSSPWFDMKNLDPKNRNRNHAQALVSHCSMDNHKRKRRLAAVFFPFGTLKQPTTSPYYGNNSLHSGVLKNSQNPPLLSLIFLSIPQPTYP